MIKKITLYLMIINGYLGCKPIIGIMPRDGGYTSTYSSARSYRSVAPMRVVTPAMEERRMEQNEENLRLQEANRQLEQEIRRLEQERAQLRKMALEQAASIAPEYRESEAQSNAPAYEALFPVRRGLLAKLHALKNKIAQKRWRRR